MARRSAGGSRLRVLVSILLPEGNLAPDRRRIEVRPMPTTINETTTETERVSDPIHKVSYSFETDGPNLWVYTRFEDGGHLPEHFHPSLEERWEVLEGTARVKLDGAWRDLVAEDGPVLVSPGVRHELENSSGRQARLRTEVRPAGRLQEFLVESARG